MSNTRGYLNDTYKLFHITDKRDADFESHCHDFHKIILCLSGNVKYIMEGKSYNICQGDILLVPKGKIHKSGFSSDTRYERIVFWIDDGYLRGFEENGNSLATCFDMANLSDVCTVSPDKDSYSLILRAITGIEAIRDFHLFGSKLMKDSYFVEFMVILNRLIFDQKPSADAFISDPKFDEILSYINRNLDADLSVEALSDKFFISRSYLMARFRELTGCSVHGYIIEKRLSHAMDLIKGGSPANIAAVESGFADYTVFYRNFKKSFGISPAQISRK